MWRSSTLFAAFLAIAQVSFAQSAYDTMEPGTLISWSFEFEETSFTRLSEVVASGPDFVIYQPDLKYKPTSAESYVVEFSGVHAQSCNEPLPDDADRQALQSLWPLTSGASASVRSGAVPARYRVQAADHADFIGSRGWPGEATWVEGQIGDAELKLLVSQDYGMHIGVEWVAGGSGRVLEVIEPENPVTDDEARTLGNCSVLLKTEFSN
ncbi:MAG: hypothetical protein WA989_16360 [Henriciella sp.]|uniref:hypothetical protein n=1 Tax=Henriciella sp. TaxID=1968823 RepID=UPI003C723DE7